MYNEFFCKSLKMLIKNPSKFNIHTAFYIYVIILHGFLVSSICKYLSMSENTDLWWLFKIELIGVTLVNKIIYVSGM